MDHDLLRKDILRDIMSTEEGRQYLIDYASGKMKDARRILDKYSEIYLQRTGQKINFFDRHLADRAEIMLRKDIPTLYEKWRDTGVGQLPGIQEESTNVLKQQEERLDEGAVKRGEIPARIQEATKASKLNENVATRITDKIIEAIENSKYYTSRIIGMDYRSDHIIEELSFEIQRLIHSVNPEDVKEILDRTEGIILHKIDKTIDENIELAKRKEEKDKGTHEVGTADSTGEAKQNSENDKVESQGESFRDELRVDVDYSEVLEKYKEENKDKTVEEPDKTNKNKPLSTDLII